MITIENILLLLAALLCGLIAGLLFAYACSVNIGLGKLSDLEYLKAMKSINRAILNPVFYLAFMGPLLLLPLCTWLNYSPPSFRFYALLMACIVYFIGVLGVTLAGNIPLNQGLENINLLSVSADKIASQRTLFESPWNRYHLIRTVAAVLSFALALIAMRKPF